MYDVLQRRAESELANAHAILIKREILLLRLQLFPEVEERMHFSPNIDEKPWERFQIGKQSELIVAYPKR